MPDGMTYIVQRKDRFCVVAYDGLDPLTGRYRLIRTRGVAVTHPSLLPAVA
jgi:hypothetical protein